MLNSTPKKLDLVGIVCWSLLTNWLNGGVVKGHNTRILEDTPKLLNIFKKSNPSWVRTFQITPNLLLLIKQFPCLPRPHIQVQFYLFILYKHGSSYKQQTIHHEPIIMLIYHTILLISTGLCSYTKGSDIYLFKLFVCKSNSFSVAEHFPKLYATEKVTACMLGQCKWKICGQYLLRCKFM